MIGAAAGQGVADPVPDPGRAEEIAGIARALAEAVVGAGAGAWRAGFDLIWEGLHVGLSAHGSAGPSPTDRDRHRLGSPTYWSTLFGHALTPGEGPPDLADVTTTLLAEREAEPERRHRLARVLASRLAYARPGMAPAARALARSAVEAAMQRLSDPAVERPSPVIDARPKTATETECAGLVILHPHLRMLLDRLEVLDGDGAIPPAHRPRALGILQAVAGRPGLPDAFMAVLLGLTDEPTFQPEPPDTAGIELIDGLLRAVVGQWGRLGKTSPDGLRETFLRRRGTLRQEDGTTWLTVAEGPFDMLLDGLPWPLTPVALPWMTGPCHVTWRTKDG
ncbi:MAG: contractile injection system tape measure protein [Pseudomonadota bacterium]